MSYLFGVLLSLISGFVFPTLWTMYTTKPLDHKAALAVWKRLQTIDNPLNPWAELYAR